MQIEMIKHNIKHYIKNDIIVNQIVKIIDESRCFSFKSDRNRFISKNRPVFIITFDPMSVSNKDIGEIRIRKPNDYDFINECISYEIISELSTFINDMISNNEELRKSLTINLKDDIDIKGFIFLNMFSTVINIQDNIIHLEYML